jgi:hypothetical protein
MNLTIILGIFESVARLVQNLLEETSSVELRKEALARLEVIRLAWGGLSDIQAKRQAELDKHVHSDGNR